MQQSYNKSSIMTVIMSTDDHTVDSAPLQNGLEQKQNIITFMTEDLLQNRCIRLH